MTYPEVDKRLYTVIKQLYSQYTGQQIADAHAQIRREITEAEEAAKLKAELKRLKALVKEQE